ncbi:MAG: hypothetical protein V4487_08180 [Chlamydiota bacterium]
MGTLFRHSRLPRNRWENYQSVQTEIAMMTFDETPQLVKKIGSFVGNASIFIYLILFLPALIYIPPLGFFSLASSDMSTGGALLCVLGAATVPFSMPVSIYFTCKNSSDSQIKKRLFFSCLPVFCSIFAILWAELIRFLHHP